jgi:hypothetical protein
MNVMGEKWGDNFLPQGPLAALSFFQDGVRNIVSTVDPQNAMVHNLLSISAERWLQRHVC